MKTDWTYRFLMAHNKLNEMQIKYNNTAPLMKKHINQISREGRELLKVSGRRFNKNGVSDQDLRILGQYQSDIKAITDPITKDFLSYLERDGFINSVKGTDHFDSYLKTSYDLIKKTYSESQSKTIDQHILTIVAFDAVTNTLHHSFEACSQVAKFSPITGNIKEDSKFINDVVRFNLLNESPSSALNAYFEYCE